MKDGWDTSADDHPQKLHLHALFISDVHLGTRTAQAERLLDLLRCCEADVIYLVGDIIDFWKVRRGPHWPQTHNDVLQKLMRKVRKGTRLVLVPGNHDEALRDYAGMQFGGVEVHRDTLHTTARGRRYVVMHGDEFDVVVRTAKWLALLGDHGYEFALWLNHPLNWVRRHLGLGYWSLSAYLKYRVQESRGLYRCVRRGRGDGSKAPGRRRHHLWSHPPRGRPERARDALPQLRRLGRELHCRGGDA